MNNNELERIIKALDNPVRCSVGRVLWILGSPRTRENELQRASKALDKQVRRSRGRVVLILGLPRTHAIVELRNGRFCWVKFDGAASHSFSTAKRALDDLREKEKI